MIPETNLIEEVLNQACMELYDRTCAEYRELTRIWSTYTDKGQSIPDPTRAVTRDKVYRALLHLMSNDAATRRKIIMIVEGRYI